MLRGQIVGFQCDKSMFYSLRYTVFLWDWVHSAQQMEDA